MKTKATEEVFNGDCHLNRKLILAYLLEPKKCHGLSVGRNGDPWAFGGGGGKGPKEEGIGAPGGGMGGGGGIVSAVY